MLKNPKFWVLDLSRVPLNTLMRVQQFHQKQGKCVLKNRYWCDCDLELQDPEATTHSDTDDQRIQFRGRRRGRGKNKKRGRGRKECQKLLRRNSSVMLQPGGGARMDSSPSSAETSPPGLATNSIFSVSFCIIDLHGGQINDPSWGKHYSLPFLPATPSSPPHTLVGRRVSSKSPSRALDLPRALLPAL